MAHSLCLNKLFPTPRGRLACRAALHFLSLTGDAVGVEILTVNPSKVFSASTTQITAIPIMGKTSF